LPASFSAGIIYRIVSFRIVRKKGSSYRD